MAKLAKAGDTISCPCCGKRFVKRTYQQVFCSNKGAGNCKDRYWNDVDEKRHRQDEEHIFSDDAFNY